ncbi:sensor histidine kinase [Parabacteroides hominis]|uniref:histidine kinase n=2 Tax=Parabacteroides TaxID=375288 RepID=A0ABR7DQA1_9BACT|nr:HAMP domain-containing sensor histidine kinase [Parabacteroides hominis]MBC5633547.1 HAMP domain-containing histidine kinase [Parabacteroides hominis]
MYSRRLYAKIVGSVVLIVLLSLIGSWLLITQLSFTLSFVCLLFILLITLFIIRLVSHFNYKVSVFFEAMRNEDTTQYFPANPDDPFMNALYADMNHILRQLGEKHIEVEEKSLYYESILRVMTHEIRNSITPIASLSADLLKHLDHIPISQQREGLEVIKSQAKNLTAFLDSYHRLTHLPEPEYKTIPVQALFTKLERLLQAEPGSERIVYSGDKADKSTGKELQVYGDANLVTLALINLIRNALQAVEGQKDGIVKVDACAGATGRLLITITDNGPGIPPERLSAIFTPFYSTKSGGSGIGLPISQRIMQLHGGQLSVSSIPNVRTTFKMEF